MLKPLVELGARITEWFEILQAQLPEDAVEVFWSPPSSDAEPTIENPRRLSARLILDAFSNHLREAPGLAFQLLGAGPLSEDLPAGVSALDALAWLRKVRAVYVSAARFLTLYPQRHARHAKRAPPTAFFQRAPTRVKLYAEWVKGVPQLTVLVFNVNTAALAWMQRQVDAAWRVPGKFEIQLKVTPEFTPGVLGVKWIPGAAAQMNGVGGEWMTLDANQALESTASALAFQHEFGHVLGFADCYVEYWSEAGQEFIYYSLDATNRMCSLAGETQPGHWDALLDLFQ